MKAYRGSRGITPPTLNLGTRVRWVASFMPRLLYPSGKNCQYLLNRKLGGSHSQSGCFYKQVIPCPCRQSNLRLSSPQPSHCIAPKLCGVIAHKTNPKATLFIIWISKAVSHNWVVRAHTHTHTHTHTHLFGPWTESTPIFSDRSVRPTLKFPSLSMQWMCAHVW